MKQATLALLLNEDEKRILLAMKKRGFGEGKWNGVGGKIEPDKGDTNIVDAVVREAREEIGVELERIYKVAKLNFRFPYLPDKKREKWDQDVHVFLSKSWWGEPRESEEMRPQWFSLNEIPYEKMWDDDKIWLPHILEGRKLRADFKFKEGELIEDHDIEFI